MQMKYVLATSLGETELYMGDDGQATIDPLKAHVEDSIRLALSFGESLNLSPAWHVKILGLTSQSN